MTVSTYSRLPALGAVSNTARSAAMVVAKCGHISYFFRSILTSVPFVMRRYSKEFVRVLADISWGNGALVVGGGTIWVAMVLGGTAGALISVEGYNALNLLGLGPATGLISSFVGTRELAPVMAALAFATQAGCRFTAQLGAMRINEEVDALDALGINSIAYLVTTRVTAAVTAAIPLFLVCLSAAYLSAQLVAGAISDHSVGTYLHYFNLMVSGRDIFFAVIKVAVFVFAASTMQCYYGYYASGGPAGVGVAAGRAMRASITVVIILDMLLTMALWSVDSGARFGG